MHVMRHTFGCVRGALLAAGGVVSNIMLVMLEAHIAGTCLLRFSPALLAPAHKSKEHPTLAASVYVMMRQASVRWLSTATSTCAENVPTAALSSAHVHTCAQGQSSGACGETLFADVRLQPEPG